MFTDPNPYASPQATNGEQPGENLFAGLAKCVVVGLGVGFLGLGVCLLLLLPVLMAIREMGLLLMVLLMPFAVWWIVVTTRRYMARKTSCFRGAMAFGVRYLVIGAGLALFLKLFVFGGAIADTPFIVLIGGMIGTVSGSMGGAFHGWYESRRQSPMNPDSR